MADAAEGSVRQSHRSFMALHRRNVAIAERASERAMTRTPQRRADVHVHPEYWQESEQHRFEDRIGSELSGIRQEVGKLRNQVTMIIGAIGILAFLLPIIAPFIRSVLQISP